MSRKPNRRIEATNRRGKGWSREGYESLLLLLRFDRFSFYEQMMEIGEIKKKNPLILKLHNNPKKNHQQSITKKNLNFAKKREGERELPYWREIWARKAARKPIWPSLAVGRRNSGSGAADEALLLGERRSPPALSFRQHLISTSLLPLSLCCVLSPSLSFVFSDVINV